MLTLISSASLGIAFICAIVVAIDEFRHPQKMWIMNPVWPVTALYFSVFGLWAYFRIGRRMAKDAMQGMSMDQMQPLMTGHEDRRDTILPGARLQSLTPTAALVA